MMPDRPPREELLQVIRRVRRRWRWSLALRSATVLVGAAVLTILAASYGLEQWRFSPAAIVVFRIVTYLVLVAVGWWFLVRPLMRHVNDQQVALYLEEHEPSLQEVLLSAVDEGTPKAAGESTALLERLVRSAVEKCEQIEFGRRVERHRVRRSVQVLGIIAVAAALLFLTGPAWLRHGASALLLPVRSVEAATPYRIEVTPGHRTVARGGDVQVAARLIGFAASDGTLFTRSRPDSAFERVPMLPGGGKDSLRATLFSVRESVEYFVEAAGVKSRLFKLSVADLPRVERLELEYVFPEYTGLSPQQVENGGDIAVLRGTTVRVRVHSTLPSRAGRIALDNGPAASLAPAADGTLEGSFRVERNGAYQVELAGGTAALAPASPQYTIDVLADQPPVVTFTRPQRDVRPTSVEEVFSEARAEDDYGVAQLDLVMSVNGGPERTIRLAGGRSAAPSKHLTAGHTFFLEEMHLQPGDVVSYYARATDNDVVQGPKSATSDIYFLQIRPFRKDYRAAESQASGQGAGGGTDPSALSDEQRRIVTGTFNVARDRDKVGANKFREDTVFLALAQGRLRERAEALAARITQRVGSPDEGMAKVAQALTDAVKAMRGAEPRLQARDPKGALPPEQQALRSLQRAEEVYRDVRVAMSQSSGGGGSSPQARDLADLFQLEMDKLRNQYETFQRGQQQASNDKVDEVLERLKELARRQEQEAERQRQMAGNRDGSAGAASARQRQLADETEETARRLERMSREQNRPDLADAARQAQQAADAMRRAAASGDASAVGQAQAAAQRLGEARERVERQRADRLTQAIEEARKRAQRLADEQKAVESEVRGLNGAGANRGQRVQGLLGRKDAQANEVSELEKQLDRAASDFRHERQDPARKLQAAADGIRDARLREKIQYSKGLVQGASPDAAASFEEQIGADLKALGERLGEAAAAASTPQGDKRAEALARAGSLAREMDSMNQRLRGRERGERGTSGRQGATPSSPGPEADPSARSREGQAEGQRGQQGATGQQASQGQSQQGQEGQGQGQGQQRQASGSQQGRGAGQTTMPGQPGPNGQGQSMAPPQGAGGGDGRPGEIGAETARQLQREARERGAEAEQLRRDLRGLGVEAKDLDRLIRDLQALGGNRAYQNADSAAALHAQLAEGFRRLEFDLRRKLDSGGEVLVSGSDDVPREYRPLIEEYYRSLARVKKK